MKKELKKLIEQYNKERMKSCPTYDARLESAKKCYALKEKIRQVAGKSKGKLIFGMNNHMIYGMAK